jgi:hypothetical protein
MKTDRNRLLAVSLVTERGVRRFVRGVYVKVTEKSLTTSDSTVLAHSTTYQLVWSLAELIVNGSPSGAGPRGR